MTRTAIRHTLSALAAMALVSAFASGPASAHKAWHCSNFRMEIGGLPSQQRSAETAYGYRSEYTARATASHYQWRWWHDYSNGGR